MFKVQVERITSLFQVTVFWMESSTRRPSSKKKQPVASIKGKKGVDESEKLLVGNGWTAAATQRMFELPNDSERIQHLLQMFSFSEHDYQYDPRSTNQIDFHLANFIFCAERSFDSLKAQFVCRSMHKLLTQGIARVQVDPSISFDALRLELFEMFQTAIQEQNSTENPISLDDAKVILNFVTTTFLRPLRLILYSFYLEAPAVQSYELRKIFQPVHPVPLSDCDEVFPVPDDARSFRPFPLAPSVNTMNLEDIKQMLQKYTEDVIDTIEKRYDLLEECVSKVTPMLSPRGP
jgi:hypothetical protein